MKQSEIREWAEECAGMTPETQFTDDELDHVAMCLHHIDRWYHEGYPIGDFLTAVVRDEFVNACCLADDTNRKALYIYALFVHNKLGDDYKKKALASS